MSSISAIRIYSSYGENRDAPPSIATWHPSSRDAPPPSTATWNPPPRVVSSSPPSSYRCPAPSQYQSSSRSSTSSSNTQPSRSQHQSSSARPSTSPSTTRQSTTQHQSSSRQSTTPSAPPNPLAMNASTRHNTYGRPHHHQAPTLKLLQTCLQPVNVMLVFHYPVPRLTSSLSPHLDASCLFVGNNGVECKEILDKTFGEN